jgi:transglutaminase-like putative cysteine protease
LAVAVFLEPRFTVPFPRLFKLTLYLLVLDAFGALYLTGILDWLGLAGILLTILGSWWADEIRVRIPNYRRLWDVITAVVLVYGILDLLFLAESFIATVIHLLVFLLVYRLYNARTHRDLLDLFILTFLQLVAACSLTISFGFLLIFCFYMILGTWGLILFHLKRETELALPERSRELLAGSDLVAPSFLLSSVGVAVTSLLLTLAIFFAIPRVGRTYLPMRTRIETMTTGFTDRVDLGAYGLVQNDPTIVMRVSFPESVVSPERQPDLRWRGVAFDSFDGQSWSLRDPARIPVRRSREGYFSVAHPRWREPFLTYEIFLEPMGTEVIFTLPRIVSVQGRFDGLAEDSGNGLSLATPPTSRLRYLAVSQPERFRPEQLRQPVHAGDYPQQIREAYLQLPTLSPRLRALARELAAGAATPYDVARQVEAYLSGNLRYTLDLRHEPGLDPLDDFLFHRKAGNCEYFAAGMAVLLRAAGIPARVVNGFQRGEWNEVGQFYAVRQRDAHSWVEVFFTGVGWVTFDPSPRAAFEEQTFGVSGWAGKYFDALRMRWNRYVIDYNVGDQAILAMSLRQQSTLFRQGLGRTWDLWSFKVQLSLRRLWRRYRYALGALAALLAAGAFFLRKVPVLGGSKSAWIFHLRTRRAPVAFYERMLRLLARRGCPRPPTATAREFASALADRPQLYVPVVELTALYERVRFGGEPLTPATERRAAALLQTLAAARR